MKAVIFFFLCTFFTLPTVFGQIKIGDNPQNIDGASVLELESSSKVLVITRVTTAQMEAIAPQRGGMVYNTDTACIHYFDGAQWINLCDAVSFTITNDPIINNRSTIEITQSEGGYNLEVAKNSILGDNIVDGGIGPDDIQDNSIGQDKLAAESVGSSELRENSVGSEELRDGTIVPTDIANTDPGRVLTTDENGIVQWEDANAIYSLTFSKIDTTLSITRSTAPGENSVNLTGLIGSDDQILTLTPELLLQIEDGNEIDLSVLNNSGTDEQTLATTNAPGNISISNGNTITLNVNDADADLTNEIQNIEEVLNDGNNAGGNLIKNLGNPIDNQDAVTKAYVDGAITGVGGTIVSTQPNNDISNNGGAFYDDGDNDAANELQDLAFNPLTNILTVTNPGTPDNEADLTSLIQNFQNSATVTISGDGTVTNPYVLNAPGNVANGSETIIDQGANITVTGNGTTATPYVITAEDAVGDGSETQLIEGANITITGIGTDADPYIINALGGATADGSETIIDPSATVTVTGTGTTGNPYVLTAAQADGSETIINSTASVTVTGDGTITAPYELNSAVTNPEAVNVSFTPAGNTASTQVQAAIEELQTEIDGISTGGVANPNDELITNFSLTGTVLNIAEGGNIPTPIDLDPTFVTEAELTAFGIDDADADPENELSDISLTGTTLNLTNPVIGAVGVDLDPTFVTEAELTSAILASDTADGDTSDNNEIQTITSTDNSVTITPNGDDFDLSVVGGTDDQNLESAILTGSDLAINIEGGNNVTADLSALTTDLELAAAILASDTADGDTSDTNEIQTITSTDNSVTITPNGDDFDLSVVGGTDDQNLESAILTGSDLAINIEGGNNVTADLSALTTDLELAAAILASDTADGDTSDTNEIQTITSTDNSVTITPNGDDFDLSVVGGTDDQNLESAILTGSDLAINIEGGNNVTADLSALTTDLELAAAILASDTADGDTSDTNEIQTITSTDNSVTITPNGDDFDLSVVGGTDDQNLESAVLTGSDLAINIEGGNNVTADLSALTTDLELAAAILASDTADGDTSDTNEIQTITSTDNSVTITPNGDDFDLSVVGGTDDQNLESAVLTGSDLAINIEGGNNVTADLSALTTDLELAAAILASDTADGDTSDNNEIQTITSTDNSVTITPNGDDFDLSVTIGQNITNADLNLDADRTIGLAGNNLRFSGTGNIRIGSSTTINSNKLHVEGTIRSEGIRNTFGTLPSSVAYSFNDDSDTGMYRAAANQLGLVTNGTEALRIDAGQNVGIGTTTIAVNTKLHVIGNVLFDGDVTVTGTHTGIPDYVFQKYFNGVSPLNQDYKFQSLEEIENFIKNNNHLPGIKSSKQVKEDGLWNLSKSNLQNLEKIEELFLHTIEQEKKIETLQEENRELSKQMDALKSQVAEIKKLLAKGNE